MINETEVAMLWDNNADRWTEAVRKGWDIHRQCNTIPLLQSLGDLSGKDVLDAGCGEGANARLLAQAGAKVVGVDISSRMIERAREEKSEKIRYEVASFSSMDFLSEESFDLVVSFMALMDSPDLNGAYREFHRLLRPGGELAFNILHPCFITRGLGWLEGKLTVDQYFATEPWIERWWFSHAAEDREPFAIPNFHRTLSDWLSRLISAGFVLTSITEPRPSKEDCQKIPSLRRWRDQAALYLHVRARKA